MHTITRFLILSFVLLFSHVSFAGEGSDILSTDTLKKRIDDIYIAKKPIRNFNIDGSYQALVYARNFTDLFDGKQTQQKLVLGNNDGGGEYRQLRLNFSGRPTLTTFFKSDIYISPGMMGMGYNTNDKLGVEIGVNLEGQINSDKGNLYFRIGGTQFTKLSTLTLWSTENKGESLFERSPWGGFQAAGRNYETYYSAGTISRDFTWGNKFIQGFSADITRLPFNLQSKIIFAKTPNNGGQTSYNSTVPSMSYGGMIRKDFGLNYIGINTFNALSRDSLLDPKAPSGYSIRNTIGYNILSVNASITFLKNDMVLAGEAGECRFVDSTAKAQYGKAVDVTLLSRHILVKSPITFHYFYIEPHYIDLEAGYNTFLKNAGTTYNGQGTNASAVGAYMSDVDLINGNRQGGDVRGEFNVHGLKINLAAGMSKEAEHLTNVLSYAHRINNVMFARVYPYQNNFGKNASLNTTFRGYYETSSIDTTNPNYKNNRINFNVVECNLKYKLNLDNRPVYIFYLGSLTSAQDFSAVIPVLSTKAYMQVQYHELEAYYKVFDKVALATYYGLETMKGNSMMQLGTGGKPTNVLGRGLGLGFDYDVSEVANLYVRGRWFNYNDKNNPYYVYKGFEATVELRIYF